jgi:hypothetical protein
MWLVSVKQVMKIRLGTSQDGKSTYRVEARSDDGLVLFPVKKSSCSFPVFCVEVIPLFTLYADMRLNGRN